MNKEDIEIKKRRLEKLEFFKKIGINPYPYSYNKKNTAKEIKDKFFRLKKEEKTKPKSEKLQI